MNIATHPVVESGPAWERHLDGGHLDEAARHLDAWLNGTGFALGKAVELRNALYARRDALAASPSILVAWGRLEARLGMPDAARACFERALLLQPGQVDTMRHLALLTADTDPQGTLARLQALLARHPDDWRAWNDGACVLRALGRHAEATTWMQAAARAGRGVATVHANEALLHYEAHRPEACQAALDAAFAIDPDCAEALHTLAMLHQSQGRPQDAFDADERALAVQPDYPQARLSLALSSLSLGRYEEGFVGYESRWAGSDRAGVQSRPTLGRAPWTGQRVHPSARIAVLPEQGFGDQIQFVRFLPALLERFHHVDWVVPGALLRLFAASFPHPRVRFHADLGSVPLHEVDWECPVLSLAMALQVRLDTVPLANGYLRASDGLAAPWATRLAARAPGPRVGLAWTGRPTLAAQALRSIDPAMLATLDRPDLRWVSLQLQAPDQPRVVPPLADWQDDTHHLTDFSDTAALVERLDLVVTVDTATAHLAGALGRPVWLLNRLGGDWRWLAGRTDSPWYASMRLFNQTAFGDWTAPLAAVATSLDAMVRTWSDLGVPSRDELPR